jgi:hypothetical protein
MKGSIVVFDDCTPSAPGVIEAVGRLIERKGCDRGFKFLNAAVGII